jgi:hypothetical protein
MAANLVGQFNVFSSIGARALRSHEVFTKVNWADDWTAQPYLFCDSASWRIAPGIPTAQLSWNYGRAKRFDKATWATVLPDNGSRRYVKIVYANDQWSLDTDPPSDLTWYGVIDGLGSRAGAVAGGVAHGQQRIHCNGLESLLDKTPIRTGAWWTGSDIKFVDRGLTFNARKADGTAGGNRTTAEHAGSHVFSGVVKDDDAFWRTQDILKYLFAHQVPRDKLGSAEIPFVIDPTNLALITGIEDQPYLATEGRTFRQILNQLLPQQRGLSYYFDVFDDEVTLMIVSLFDSAVTFPSVGSISANPRRWSLATDREMGELTTTLSHHEACDRVRIRGRRARSVFSISYADVTLVKGWPDAIETEYEAGATGTAPYSAATGTEEKQRLNQEARSRDKLLSVFRRFKLPDNWDGHTKHSGGGGGGLQFHWPLTSETANYLFYQREVYFLSKLPMKDGYNYQAITSAGGGALPPVKVSQGPFNGLPPLVVIKVPEKDRYVQIEKVGKSGALEKKPGQAHASWSAHAHVPEMDRALVINVSNGQQWIIGGTDFTPLTEDEKPTRWDWKTIIATVAIEVDEFCEGVWPETANVPVNDHVREFMLDAPDTYRLDWLVPDTVIGVDSAGALIRCTLGGWINDDRPKLIDRARMAFEYYGRSRQAMTFRTSKVNNSILPGDLIATLGSASPLELNSVVTDITVSSTPGTPENPPPPTSITYTTDFIRNMDFF